ncbi:unnamed protein product (macronuclear) [Paramecium tetraurelia]|uniref:IBB domain-containing protein n=1 Tax=Paramecium tetraurelia TaxID=5888 RepID=A0DME1_PARTE|nr:uncharacterized protein GSPATT00018426001 [Paramecium tetraurelia]CAK84208.1 unnamed protein product [Paramecium tetraurelia]|eukprot:XP_001451605.1 hypothetical protein (macronuclear) [Paramecium tetraurelia strain d4-2]
MINSQVQLKREQFVIQIRKQAREEIFSKKRLTVLNGNLDADLKCSPDEMIFQIYKSFMLKDFKTLKDLLYKYNEQFLIILLRKQQADNIFMNQYINHFGVNQETIQLFMQILQMSDIPQLGSIDEITILCINQVLVILVNITYLTAPQIINNLLSQEIQDILLNDILGRMNTKKNLDENLEVWQSIIDSLCQLFINLLLDLKDQRGVQMKIEILKSPFFKIWQYIYKEYPPQQLWISILYLQQLLFMEPAIQGVEIIQSNVCLIISTQMQRILKQCGYVIKEFSDQDQLYELALILINYCTQYQLETTIVLTKQLWVKMIQINKFPLLMYSLFINFTSVNYDQDSPASELTTEKHLIEIGLLNNMMVWLSNLSDENLIIKIYKCLNNVLTFQYPQLANVVIYHFLPFLNLFLEGQMIQKAELADEFLILVKNLIKFQKLTEINLNQIFIEQNVMQQIRVILLQSCFKACNLLNLFNSLDLLSIEFKYSVLKRIVEHQIVDILNMLYTKNIITDDCIDTLMEQIAKWESETNKLNYS